MRDSLERKIRTEIKIDRKRERKSTEFLNEREREKNSVGKRGTDTFILLKVRGLKKWPKTSGRLFFQPKEDPAHRRIVAAYSMHYICVCIIKLFRT